MTRRSHLHHLLAPILTLCDLLTFLIDLSLGRHLGRCRGHGVRLGLFSGTLRILKHWGVDIDELKQRDGLQITVHLPHVAIEILA